MDDTYAKLGMDPSETTSLEEYMEEYFSKILKKLKEVGGQSRQKDFTRESSDGGRYHFFSKSFSLTGQSVLSAGVGDATAEEVSIRFRDRGRTTGGATPIRSRRGCAKRSCNSMILERLNVAWVMSSAIMLSRTG